MLGFVLDGCKGGGSHLRTGCLEGDQLLDASLDLVHVPGHRLAQGVDEGALDFLSTELDGVEPVAREGDAGHARGEHGYEEDILEGDQ